MLTLQVRGGLARRGRQLQRGGVRRGVTNRGGGLRSLRQRQSQAVQAQRQTARNASMDAKRNLQVIIIIFISHYYPCLW